MPFDAFVGRYVLLYQPDPSATIRSLLRSVKPGGIVAFYEFDSRGPDASCRHASKRGIPPWRASRRSAARQAVLDASFLFIFAEMSPDKCP